jgi:hypothetical protein
MSISQKPGGGSFQSFNVQIGASRRVAQETPMRRCRLPAAAPRTSTSLRAIVAARTDLVSARWATLSVQ